MYWRRAFEQSAQPVCGHEPRTQVLFTACQQTNWMCSQASLGSRLLQFTNQGGPSITVGISPTAFTSFRTLISTPPGGICFNGRLIGKRKLVILPPGSRYTIASPGRCTWLSVLDPAAPEVWPQTLSPESQLIEYDSRALILSMPPLLVRKVLSIGKRLKEPPQQNDSDVAEELLTNLMAEIGALAGSSMKQRLNSSQRQIRLDQTIYRALELIQDVQRAPTNVGELCIALENKERSLRRAFQAYFQIGPGRFMRIYRLNQVHQALLTAASPEETVTGVLSSYAITEYGRFAGDYRALFRELPSETRRNRMASTVSGTSH